MSIIAECGSPARCSSAMISVRTLLTVGIPNEITGVHVHRLRRFHYDVADGFFRCLIELDASAKGLRSRTEHELPRTHDHPQFLGDFQAPLHLRDKLAARYQRLGDREGKRRIELATQDFSEGTEALQWQVLAVLAQVCRLDELAPGDLRATRRLATKDGRISPRTPAAPSSHHRSFEGDTRSSRDASEKL